MPYGVTHASERVVGKDLLDRDSVVRLDPAGYLVGDVWKCWPLVSSLKTKGFA